MSVFPDFFQLMILCRDTLYQEILTLFDVLLLPPSQKKG